MVVRTYWCKSYPVVIRVLPEDTEDQDETAVTEHQWHTCLWFPQFYDVKTLRIWEHCFWKLVFLFGILILLLTNLWIDGSDYLSIKGHFKGNIYIYVCMYMCVYVYLVDILNHKKWCYIVILFVEKWIHLERIILGEQDEDRQHITV